VVKRGNCSFTDKAVLAGRLGYSGLVIIDNEYANLEELAPPGLIPGEQVQIPVVMVNYGQWKQVTDSALAALAGAGTTISTEKEKKACAAADASLLQVSLVLQRDGEAGNSMLLPLAAAVEAAEDNDDPAALAVAVTLLAMTLEQYGRLEESLIHYRRAAGLYADERHAEAAQALCNAGKIERRLNRFDAATSLFREAARRIPRGQDTFRVADCVAQFELGVTELLDGAGFRDGELTTALATPARERPLGHRRIPRVVHLMWLGPKQAPEAIMETWTNRFATANPHWRVMVWRDDDILELGLSTNNKGTDNGAGVDAAVHGGVHGGVFDETPGYCGKADIARYELLYR
jgi:tetratricopeptide (TPR) repeat protein